MQANSAGLTLNLLNLAYISDRWLMRDTDSEDMTSYSVMVNNDGFSKGKHLGFFETMSCKLFEITV